jgi:diguanylate cyclase (GGDEF)-like protein
MHRGLKQPGLPADADQVNRGHRTATSGRLRDGAACGLLAEAVILPAVVTVALLDQQNVRWAAVAGAAGTLVAALLFLVMVRWMTRSPQMTAPADDTWLVIACLVLVGLALIDLATGSPAALASPAILLGSAYVFLAGAPRDAKIAGPVALALLTVVAWADNVRGVPLWLTIGAYAATLGALAAICTHIGGRRTTTTELGPTLAQIRCSIDEVLAGQPGTGDTHVDEVLAVGLTGAATLLNADRVVALVVDGPIGGRTVIATWPDITTPCADLVASDAIAGVLATHSVVVNDRVCALPAGFTTHGEMVLVAGLPAQHASASDSVAELTETADRLGSELLRATSRIAFAQGPPSSRRTDPLTGLCDLDALLERLDIEMHRSLRSDAALAVAVIDIDHLGLVNEDFGTAAGDGILRGMAAILVSNTRAQDAIGRTGGGQFCLVLPDTDLVGAQHLIESLRIGGRDATSSLGTTVSAGITCWDGGEDPEDLVERARRALYRAKSTGRNRVVTIAVADH